MRAVCRLAVACVLASALCGCAYKPLKAPCSLDEGGTPLGYADESPHPVVPQPFVPLDSCGPMKPI